MFTHDGSQTSFAEIFAQPTMVYDNGYICNFFMSILFSLISYFISYLFHSKINKSSYLSVCLIATVTKKSVVHIYIQ